MPQKRAILEEHLTRDKLGTIVEHYELQVADRRHGNSSSTPWQAPAAALADILLGYSRDRLKELCRALDLDDAGREKSVLVERLIGAKTAEPPADPVPAKPARTSKPMGEPRRQASPWSRINRPRRG